MPKHDYTARDALNLLVGKVETLSPALAQRIRSATDSGRDAREEDTLPAGAGRRKAKPRYYRKHIAYNDQEAVEVALTVLESHLIESRMLVNAAYDEFQTVALAPPKGTKAVGSAISTVGGALEQGLFEAVFDNSAIGTRKDIVIEVETEAVQDKRSRPDLHLSSIDERELQTLRELFRRLRLLLDFK
jgi:hypothetical protein